MSDFQDTLRTYGYRVRRSAWVTDISRTLASWRDHPDLFRRMVRDSTPSQVLACALLAIMVAAAVVLLHHIITFAHAEMFLIPQGSPLSSAQSIDTHRLLLVLVGSGLLLGLSSALSRLWNTQDTVDPIEANAVHGGRLSLFDSGRLVMASLLSNACGASVGMEAAYTQMGAAILSCAGKFLHLRREDLRIFVAAGAAAAIAAAFNAPLAGAFYGFELILSAYTVNAISQVAVAALFGTLTGRLLTGGNVLFALPLDSAAVPNWYYLLFLAEGIGAALIGILTMMAVTRCEYWSRKLSVPDWLRPALGGLFLALLAIAYPQVLGSGQGAINLHLHEQWPIAVLVILLAMKIGGSAISIGAGFRGGLFSSSLFIGCLFGQLFGLMLGHFLPPGAEHLDLFILVGMGATAASIVGAPVTIVLLILEMTDNLSATTSVLMGVLIASALTRHYFGYSFSTWRFHLRGLRIAGAHDIGWIAELSVAKLMRTDSPTAPITASVAELRAIAEPNSTKRIFVLDAQQRYVGTIDANHLPGASENVHASDLMNGSDRFLLPGQNIQQAMQQFAQWEAEALPVLDTAETRQLIGYLSEAYTLRRYAQELETRNLAQFGTASPMAVATKTE